MKFKFFWGGPFSQWHPSIFTVGNFKYNCAEQYMMARKAELFGDSGALEKIKSSCSPSEQKAIGREIKNFDPTEWAIKARNFVYTGNHYKFKQNPHLMEELLATRDFILVEASPYDKIWGIGMDVNNPKINDWTEWRGLNWLGLVLTDLREDFIHDLGE